MIRFYTMGIWKLVAAEGYAFVMRMDEESFLWSPITYNLFEFMAAHRIEYGFRMAAWEHGHSTAPKRDFHSLVRQYVQERNVSVGWLLDECPAAHRVIQNYSLSRCGEPYGIYNNFFIANLSFWLRPDVQSFLTFVNRTHTIYTRRFNDILWQSAALKLFMDPERIHMFQVT